MIGNRWFCMPDDDREPWCFLTLELGDSEEGFGKPIVGWRLGYGNPRKITRILSSDGSSEEEVVRGLFEEVRFCRRKGTTLITLSAEVLPALRTRTLLLGLDGAGLGRVRHICIERLLGDYFLGFEEGVDLPHARRILESAKGTDIETGGLDGPEVLWRLYSVVGPLLPKGCFRGPSP